MRKKVLEINHPLYEKKQTYWEYSSSQYMLTKKLEIHMNLYLSPCKEHLNNHCLS